MKWIQRLPYGKKRQLLRDKAIICSYVQPRVEFAKVRPTESEFYGWMILNWGSYVIVLSHMVFIQINISPTEDHGGESWIVSGCFANSALTRSEAWWRKDNSVDLDYLFKKKIPARHLLLTWLILIIMQDNNQQHSAKWLKSERNVMIVVYMKKS